MISTIRTFLYSLAKYLGDANALLKAKETDSFRPIALRLYNRSVGKILTQVFKKK